MLSRNQSKWLEIYVSNFLQWWECDIYQWRILFHKGDVQLTEQELKRIAETRDLQIDRRLAQSNILPIDMLYYKSVGVLTHDIDHDLAPQYLKNLFTSLAFFLEH